MTEDSRGGDVMRKAPLTSPGMQQTLADRGIELQELIGRGAESLVFKGYDSRLARDVAVKVIDASTASEHTLQRFNQEVRVVASLRHPNILPLFDAGQSGDGSIFAVMPLASGTTLREVMNAGVVPVGRAVKYAADVAEALAYAHDRGVVHRDIKPENILVEHGNAIVADFGLARERVDIARRILDELRDPDIRKTVDGMFVGTPLYASPEQVLGDLELDGRSDLFSLGCVLFEMLVGKAAYARSTVRETMLARMTGPPLTTRAERRRLKPVAHVLRRTLTTSPHDRYATAQELVEALTLTRDLLAGSRGGSWRRAATVIGMVMTLGLVWFATRTKAPLPVLDLHGVVVADFDNETGDSSYARLSDVLSELVAGRMSQDSSLRVSRADEWLPRVARASRLTNREHHTALRTIADSAAAATVVSGALFWEGPQLRLLMEVTDARNGVLLSTIGPTTVDREAPEGIALTLGSHLVRVLRAQVDSSEAAESRERTRGRQAAVERSVEPN